MSHFRAFAEQVVNAHDEHLLDYGPDEQVHLVITALENLNTRAPLRPHCETVNAFGFGTAPTCFATGAGGPREIYLQFLPLAEAIGFTPEKAQKLAQTRRSWQVQDQRTRDEETGVLGWDLMNDWVDLGMSLIIDSPDANPDTTGRRWTYASEWLVTLDRLPDLVLSSPWGKEFADNAQAMFSYAFKSSGAETKAGDAPLIVQHVGDDGAEKWVKSGRTLADALAVDRHGVSEDEARRRAFRGPTAP